jgi:hypothetical protein
LVLVSPEKLEHYVNPAKGASPRRFPAGARALGTLGAGRPGQKA